MLAFARRARSARADRLTPVLGVHSIYCTVLLGLVGFAAFAAPADAQDMGLFAVVDHWRPDEFGSEHGTNLGIGIDRFGREDHAILRLSGAYVFHALEDVDVTDYLDLSATLSYIPLSADLPVRPFAGGGLGYVTFGPTAHLSPVLTGGVEFGRGNGQRIAIQAQYWTRAAVPRTVFALIIG